MVACTFASGVRGADSQPAMITSGSDSVAAKLHYPPKESAAKYETVLTFYCEIDTQGKAHHVRSYWNKGCESFRDTVEKAPKTGRFVPAQVGGKPTPVMVGGTVFFLSKSGS